MKSRCPHCSEYFDFAILSLQEIRVCPQKNGYSLPLWSLEFLNKNISADKLRRVIAHAPHSQKKCWTCLSPLRRIAISNSGHVIEICHLCEDVFLDPGATKILLSHCEWNSPPSREGFSADQIRKLQFGEVQSLLGIFQFRGLPMHNTYPLITWSFIFLTYFFRMDLNPNAEYFSYIPRLPWYMQWGILTHVFVHADFGHWLGNSIGMFLFGTFAEKELKHWKFLGLVLTCILGSILFDTLIDFHLKRTSASVGASGIVFGLLAYVCWSYPKAHFRWGIAKWGFFWIPLPVYFVYHFLTEYFAQKANAINDNVGHLAHIGGALAGILWIALFESDGKKISPKNLPIPRRINRL